MSMDPTTVFEPDDEAEGRDRSETIRNTELSAQSIVGSFFLKIEAGRVVEKGLIVAEVEPRSDKEQGPVYLAELIAGDGVATFQRLVPWEQMLSADYEWRFFDSEEWMESNEIMVGRLSQQKERTEAE